MPNTWSTKTPIPEASLPWDGAWGRLPNDNTKLYYLCGSRGDNNNVLTRIYSIAGDSWSYGTNAPEAIQYVAVTYGIGDSIFVVRHDSDTLTPFQYKPSTDEWIGPLTSQPLSGSATGYGAGYGSKIYVWNHSGGYYYDIDTNAWTSVAARPLYGGDGVSALRLGGAGTLGSYIYAWGGKISNLSTTRSSDFDRYDPASNSWTRLSPSFPIDVSHPGCCTDGQHLWSLGGVRSADVVTNKFYVFNGSVWTEKQAINDVTVQHGLVVAQQKVWACRLRTGNPSTHMVYEPDISMPPEVGPFGGTDGATFSIRVAPEEIPHRFSPLELESFGIPRRAAHELARKLNDNFDSAERQLKALDPDYPSRTARR